MRLYCKCGASLTSTPMEAEAFAKILRVWSKGHTGEGHGLVDAKKASRARRRAEREVPA